MKKLIFLIFLISLTFSWQIQLPENLIFGGIKYSTNYVVFTSSTTLYLINVHNGKFLFINLGKITEDPIVVNRDIFVPTSHSITKVYYTSSLQKIVIPLQIPPSMSDEELNITGLDYLENNKFVLRSNNKLYIIEYKKAEGTFLIKDEIKEVGNVIYTKRGDFLIVNSKGIYFYDLKKYVNIKNIVDVITTQNTIYAGDSLGNLYKISYNGEIDKVLFLGGSINAIYDSLLNLIISTTKGTFKVDKNLKKFVKIDEFNTGTVNGIFKYSNFYILFNSKNIFILSDQGIVLEKHIKDCNIIGSNGPNVILINKNFAEGIDLSQGCVILSPRNYEKIGYLPITIKGRGFGINVLPNIKIRFNGGKWINIGNKNDWTYVLDPNDFEFGFISIDCAVNNNLFSFVILKRVKNFPKKKFVISFPNNIIEGKRITFSVKDAFGNFVNDYTVLIGKNKYMRKVGTFTITFKSPGEYTLIFKKPGFEDKELKIKVESKLPLIQLIFGIVVLVGIYIILKKANLLK